MMAYKSLDINSPISEITDFCELQCALSDKKFISVNDLRADLSMPDDEDDISGVLSSDDRAIEKLDEALNLATQKTAYYAEGKYPYSVQDSSLILGKSRKNTVVYLFLLLVTRMDMSKDRVQDGIDATLLFERLCALVAKEYFGNNALCYVFGTSTGAPFKDKVDVLLKSIHSKGEYRTPCGYNGKQKDAGVDIVSWIPFADKRGGQLIAMGQCKTGTSWGDMLGSLNPISFFKCYSSIQPYVDPIKLFFVAEDVYEDRWEKRCNDAGIIFDRSRIMQFLPNEFVDEDLDVYSNISQWVNAAIKIMLD